MTAVLRITLAASLGTARDPNSFLGCSICRSILTISTTSRGDSPADRRRAAFTPLIDVEQDTTAKRCLIRFGLVAVSRMASVDAYLHLLPSDTIIVKFRSVSSRCDSIMSWSSRLSRALFVSANTVQSVSLSSSSLLFDSSGFICFGVRADQVFCPRLGRGYITKPQPRYTISVASHAFEVDGLRSNPLFCGLCCDAPQAAVPVVYDWLPRLLH